jgi:3-dehydroquinate synthase
MSERTSLQVGGDVGAGSEAAYPVVIGSGVEAEMADLLRIHARAHRYAVISDSHVAPLHAERMVRRLRGAGLNVALLAFPAGEANKNRDWWASLSDSLLTERFGRDSAIVALGGGVTGDLAGFVAATYMRGIPVVQVPTSLLAMVDSSVGGKTGVDTAAGKNLIGSFHPPALVVIDTDLLRTLPLQQLRSGLAEAVKHGAIADAEYLGRIESEAEALLRGDAEPLACLVERSVRIKAGVVSADPHEGGMRKILNFGHTLGHALELCSGFSLLHGEAVAIGMVLEARLGEALGVTASGTADDLARVLQRLQLPTSPPEILRSEEIIAATMLDKKARSGRAEYALIERIGQAAAPTEVPREEVERVLGGAGAG